MNPEECCPKFDPAPWQDKLFEWKDKKFIKTRVLTFFYIPVNFGRVMRKVMRQLDSEKVELVDNLVLSDHTSKWNMDLYLAVEQGISDMEKVELSGKIFSKVYEGPYRDTKKWCRDFEAHAKKLDLKINKWYMWYTTCPKCAKKYGKNYVVILGEIL
jgi:hypothetical protein